MIFCQACGAQNTTDARFCNMCGGGIARLGEPAGPIAAPVDSGAASTRASTPASMNASRGNTLGAAPNAMHNQTSITLAGYGVQSAGKTYAILIGGALCFLALGAGGGYLAMHAGDAPPAAAPPEPEPEQVPDTAPVEIGDPLPVGEVTPEEGSVIGGPRVTPRRRPSGGTTNPGGGGTTNPGGGGTTNPGGGGTTNPGGGGTTNPAGGGTTTPGGGGTTNPGGGGTTNPGGGGGTTDPAGGGTTDPGGGTTNPGGGTTNPGGGTTDPGTGPARDWAAMQEGVGGDEADLVMEHYSVTVRRYIRNYYALRAASCFDHESRATGETVRGAVVVAFTIAGNGRVEGARVTRNTTNRDSLGACLQRNVASWQLPAPPNGEPIDMEMPFSR
jgi:hypothetical protein